MLRGFYLFASVTIFWQYKTKGVHYENGDNMVENKNNSGIQMFGA